MLKWSEQNFKATTMEIISIKNENTNFQQRNRSDKKNLMEIVKLKNTITGIKNSLDGLNSRVEITEDGSSKFEDKSIDSLQSEQRENRMKKKMGKAWEAVRNSKIPNIYKITRQNPSSPEKWLEQDTGSN